VLFDKDDDGMEVVDKKDLGSNFVQRMVTMW